MNKTELKTSEDGSSTLYRPDIDEHYHSIHGALTESMHVFINNGLKHSKANTVHLLEIGFGTGLNALLTLIHQQTDVKYHALEKFPIDKKLSSELNYPVLVNELNSAQLFRQLHDAPWNKDTEIRKNFLLTKLQTDLLLFKAENIYDVVYFDAFAPDKQPELWTEEVFRNIFFAMRKGGILTTYCAKGVVRRTMQAVGFAVERLPGPPGKWEMLRATKTEQF